MNPELISVDPKIVAFYNNTINTLLIEESSLTNSAVVIEPGANRIPPEPYSIPGFRDEGLPISISYSFEEEVSFENHLYVWLGTEGEEISMHYEAANQTESHHGSFVLNPKFSRYRLSLIKEAGGGLVIIGTLDGLVDEEPVHQSGQGNS